MESVGLVFAISICAAIMASMVSLGQTFDFDKSYTIGALTYLCVSAACVLCTCISNTRGKMPQPEHIVANDNDGDCRLYNANGELLLTYWND